MFDFDAGKLLIIGIVALVFIPSKDLPRVLRQIGQFVGKMRRMASDFQGQFMDAMREADLAELRREAEKLQKAAEVNVGLDAVHDLNAELTVALEGKAALSAHDAAVLGAESEAATAHQVHTIAPPELLAPPAPSITPEDMARAAEMAVDHESYATQTDQALEPAHESGHRAVLESVPRGA